MRHEVKGRELVGLMSQYKSMFDFNIPVIGGIFYELFYLNHTFECYPVV